MSLARLATDPIALLSFISVSSAAIAVFLPQLGKDRLSTRLAQVAGEAETNRRHRDGNRDLHGLAALFDALANRFDILRRLPGGEAAHRLQMAGLRGPSALTTYLSLRIVGVLALGPICFFYLRFVIELDQPLPVLLLASLAGSLFGFFLPAVLLKNRIIKRQQAIQRAWPNALDLMLICVESGMGIDQALRKVADEIGLDSVDLAEELMLTVSELSYLPDRRMAYENLAARTGLDTVKAVIASLKQAERHGTSLGASLRVLSQENRDMRLQAAEKKAASLPPKLTVPMILFFLPVLFAVIIAPALMQVFGS
ncbi:type II secretion system F family protein [Paragemmobacter straminiformis]|uniref:Type II secretion system F family protein n=1 Tax=Paragemmobacter straminiformis TaxID=2045119 RepID=A0A842I817_9RHOB|nr:type II secretion system F family protein [Gemmobacter straminiformis]MBC2835775.1 type II secretion system F family protein [Gemmobacter straminiformis]